MLSDFVNLYKNTLGNLKQNTYGQPTTCIALYVFALSFVKTSFASERTPRRFRFPFVFSFNQNLVISLKV